MNSDSDKSTEESSEINQQEQLNKIRERFDEVGLAEIISGEEHEFYNEMQAQLSNEDSLNQVSYALLEVFANLDLSFIELCIIFQNIKEEAAFCFNSREHLDEKSGLELREVSIESIAEEAKKKAESE